MTSLLKEYILIYLFHSLYLSLSFSFYSMPNIVTNDLNSLAKLKPLPENMGVCVCGCVRVEVSVCVCECM